MRLPAPAQLEGINERKKVKKMQGKVCKAITHPQTAFFSYAKSLLSYP